MFVWFGLDSNDDNKNMLLPVKRNSFTHLRVLLVVLTERGILGVPEPGAAIGDVRWARAV
jgi:hypothetical protein